MNRNNCPDLLLAWGGDRLVGCTDEGDMPKDEWVDTDGSNNCELVEGRSGIGKARVELVEEDEVFGKRGVPSALHE